MLTREEILAAAPELRGEVIHVPEMGGEILVREMTGTDLDRFEAACSRCQRLNLRGLIVAYTVCYPDGRRAFTEADADALAGWPARVLVPITEAAGRVCRLSVVDREDFEKNSESGPSDGSS